MLWSVDKKGRDQICDGLFFYCLKQSDKLKQKWTPLGLLKSEQLKKLHVMKPGGYLPEAFMIKVTIKDETPGL